MTTTEAVSTKKELYFITYYHVNKLKTHFSYGHYHKYNNYFCSVLYNSARLSNDDRLGRIYELPYPFVTFNIYSSKSLYSTAYKEDIDWIRPLHTSFPDFSRDCHIWRIKKYRHCLTLTFLTSLSFNCYLVTL